MRQLTAFTKKEFMELIRTGKLLILGIIFLLFGIMNPAIAKMTPWIMEMASEELGDMGVVLTDMQVDAMTSWMQYYKNIPIACVVFLLFFGGILTNEYQRGTLVNMITKGLERWKVIVSKAAAMLAVWTAGYWLCYGITYGYNAYFWDNGIAKHLVFSAFCVYLTGIWLNSLILVMSAVFSSNSAVLAAAGGVFFAFYLAGLLSDIKKYLPVKLLDASELLYGLGESKAYWGAVAVTMLLSVLNIIIAIVCFDRKRV